MTRIALLIAGLALAVGGCTNPPAGETTTVIHETAVPETSDPATGDNPTAAAEVPPQETDGSIAPEVLENAQDLLAACVICEVADYAGPLEPDEAQGLLLALNDEYHAEAVYQQVLDDFGDETRPFSNIITAEQRHQTSLLGLFATYELAVPENPWLGNIEEFDTVADACTVGAEAEIINASLYDYLYSTTDRADIVAVYERLQAASNDKHLPAFERCSDGTVTAGSSAPAGRGGSGRRGAGRTG